MTNPHVLSALRDKRAEIAGALQQAERQINRLRLNLSYLDGTLLVFDPNSKPEAIPSRILRGMPANSSTATSAGRSWTCCGKPRPRCPRAP